MEAVQRSLKAQKGSNATLICLGHKVYQFDTVVSWKFNGNEITETDTNKKAVDTFRTEGPGNFSLHITNVSEKDFGKYTCIARADNFNVTNDADDFINLTPDEKGEFYLELFLLWEAPLSLQSPFYHNQPSRFSCICCRSYWFQALT